MGFKANLERNITLHAWLVAPNFGMTHYLSFGTDPSKTEKTCSEGRTQVAQKKL